MALNQPVKQGLSAPAVTSIPQTWDPEWFRRFITNYLQPGDIRNTTSGTGIAITPSPNGVGSPGTVSLNAQYANLVNEPYVLAAAPGDTTLNDYRVIVGESGVVTITDAGALNTIAVGIAVNGIGDTQLRQSALTSVVGNPTTAAANVQDIASTSDGQVLQQAGGVLVFAQLPATVLAPIPADTVLGNDTGAAASPTPLTQAQLTSLIKLATTTLTGAMPALSGVATQYLNGAGAFTTPPAPTTAANPIAQVGLTAVNGTAGTYMRSDAAPALNQGIIPTWTGAHTFAAPVQVNDGFNSTVKPFAAAYTTLATDVGTILYHQGGTVDALTLSNTLGVGGIITVIVGPYQAGCTIVPAAGFTLYWLPSGSAGTRTLATGATARIVNVGSAIYTIDGTGIT